MKNDILIAGIGFTNEQKLKEALEIIPETQDLVSGSEELSRQLANLTEIYLKWADKTSTNENAHTFWSIFNLTIKAIADFPKELEKVREGLSKEEQRRIKAKEICNWYHRMMEKLERLKEMTAEMQDYINRFRFLIT